MVIFDSNKSNLMFVRKGHITERSLAFVRWIQLQGVHLFTKCILIIAFSSFGGNYDFLWIRI